MKLLLLLLSLGIGGVVVSSKLDLTARSGWTQMRRPGPASGFAAPELDPGAAGSAMVLLLGGLAYFASRRREEPLA
jgi:hypothetical protein